MKGSPSIFRSPFQPALRSVFDVGMGGEQPLAAQVVDALGASLVSMRYPTPDFAGLYQDAVGTTPVTAVGQPVGLMLDRRLGLVRGADVYPESGWSNVNPAAQVNGKDVVFNAASSGTYTEATIPVVSGSMYELTYTITSFAGGKIEIGLSGDTNNRNTDCPSTVGTHTIMLTAPTGTPALRVRAGGVSTFSFTFVSIREIPGNHASQPTTTARPTLRSGPLRIDYDGVDDLLRTVFPALGSSVTIARSIPGTGAQILTGQTIAAGNWDDSTDSCATLVIDRAMTGPETALVTAFLDQQAGI